MLSVRIKVEVWRAEVKSSLTFLGLTRTQSGNRLQYNWEECQSHKLDKRSSRDCHGFRQADRKGSFPREQCRTETFPLPVWREVGPKSVLHYFRNPNLNFKDNNWTHFHSFPYVPVQPITFDCTLLNSTSQSGRSKVLLSQIQTVPCVSWSIVYRCSANRCCYCVSGGRADHLVPCVCFGPAPRLQYLDTGLVHQLDSYWMHTAALIDSDTLFARGRHRRSLSQTWTHSGTLFLWQ